MSLLRYGAIMPPMRLTEQVGYPTGYLSPWYEWTEVGERPLYYEGHWNGSAVVPLEQWDGQEYWTPILLPNLVAWYDPSDSATVTLDGSSKVSQLDDKSGNARHVTQSTPASRLGMTTMNSLDALLGSGSTNFLALSGGLTTAQPFTVGCVYKATAASADEVFVALGSGNNYMPNVWNRDVFLFNGASLGGALAKVTVGTPAAMVMKADGSSSTIRLDGAQKYSGNSGGTNGSQIVLGGGSPTGSYPLVGVLGEVVIVGAALSAENQTLLESYLMTKWGIT